MMSAAAYIIGPEIFARTAWVGPGRLDQLFESLLKTSAWFVYQVLLRCGVDLLLQEIQLQVCMIFQTFLVCWLLLQ